MFGTQGPTTAVWPKGLYQQLPRQIGFWGGGEGLRIRRSAGAEDFF